MSRSWPATPTLDGEDARRFLEETFSVQYSAERERENAEALALFQRFNHA